MLIFTVLFIFLFELHFKDYGRPNVVISKYFILRKARFSVLSNYSVTWSVSPEVVLMYMYATNKTNHKPSSSMVTTCLDKENKAFLVAH